MAVFIVMPKKVESDRVGDRVAHSFCSHARKKNGTRLFGREVNFLSIVFPFLEPRRGVFWLISLFFMSKMKSYCNLLMHFFVSS